MKLAWISELGYKGKLDPKDPNQRVDIVWQIALETNHHNWVEILENPELLEQYDAALFVVPKNNPIFISHIIGLVNKTPCKMILVQEGPCWFWQDWSAFFQAQYYSLLKVVDGVFVHGNSDKRYYEAIAGRKCYILPTMYNPDYLSTISPKTTIEGTAIVGGNSGTWYSGEVSASTIRDNPAIKKVLFPTMGRKKEHEDILMGMITNKDIQYLPYQNWTEFIRELGQAQYAIHLMSAAAAGTFNLNCALLGIPCIGNHLTDTQRICFPDLCCEVTDATKAKELLTKLTTDKEFYKEVSEKAKKNAEYFSTKNRVPEVLKNIEGIIYENT